MDVYQRQGFKDRGEYLASLAAQYEVDPEVVDALATLLGENEDFDGLVTELSDLSL